MGLKKGGCDKHRSDMKAQGFEETTKKSTLDLKVSEGATDGGSVVCTISGKDTTYYFYKEAVSTTEKWKCDGGPNCIGDGGDGSGTYATKEECETAEANCSTPTPDPAPDPAPDPTPDPTPSTSSYTTCNGPTYKKWCKDSGARYRRPNPSGMIYKLQGCLGVYQDSFFGPKTEKALKDAFNGKTQVTDEEIDELCKTTDQGQQTTTQLENWGKEDWEKLITSGEISPNSFIKSRTDGTHVAIQKIDRAKLASGSNDDVPREPTINSTKGITDDDLTKYAYLVLFPPKLNSNELKGDIKEIRRCKNSNNLCLVGPDPSSVEGFAPDEWTWTANPPEDIISEAIKRKLNQLLREQSLSLPGYGPQGTTTTTGTQGTTTATGTQGTTTTTPAKLDPEKVSKVIEPIKQETIVALEEIQNNSLFNNVATDEDKEQLQQAIDLLNDFDSSKACEQENVDMINNNIKLIDGILIEKQTELNTIVGKKLKQNLLTVKGNLEKVKSECVRLQKQLQSSSGSGAQGTTTSTSGSGTQGTTTSTSSDEQGGDTDLRTMFGFDKKSPARKALKKTQDENATSLLGEGTIQNAIDNSGAKSEYFAKFNELLESEGLSDLKLRFPDTAEYMAAEVAGEIITEENMTALFPSKNEKLSDNYQKNTFGDYLDTACNLPIYVLKGQERSTQEQGSTCPYTDEQLKRMLVTHIYNGLAEGGQKTSNTTKKALCTCAYKGRFDDIKITMEDFETISGGITKKGKQRPFNMFNRKLGFRDIKKLMNGDKVSGRQLQDSFQLSGFGTFECRGTMSESRLKSNISSLITEAVTTKRKERTREVIVEDLLRTIRGY